MNLRSHKALLFQGGKALVILTLLGVPLIWPSAKPKAPPPTPTPVPTSPYLAPPIVPETVTEAAPTKKEKKKKAKKAPKEEKVAGNQLTNEAGRKLTHYDFTVPPELKPAVDFWKLVYSKYDRRYEIFHDTKDLSRIYSVLDFSDIYSAALSDSERRLLRKERLRDEKDRIRAILQRLSYGDYTTSQLDREERRIYELFKNDPDPDKFVAASEDGRLRSQTGIQDKFLTGLAASGEYMEEIEDIFTSYGVPVEITRLVFVESMFNTKARSKVGASGIWQFMPSTGRLYMNIDGVADERNDPILASHAAARLLRDNYQALGTWPLAINAYNSGRGTLSRAVDVLGTSDIATIILNYSGGVYGFASRNFYPCFLAALELANGHPQHFGKLKIKPRLRYEYYYLKNPQRFPDLVATAGASYEEISRLNPHFSGAILSGVRKVPAGYKLRVPHGAEVRFAQAERNILMGPGAGVTAVAVEVHQLPRSEESGDLGLEESGLISQDNALDAVNR
ncbi:MAG TPA: lytic transglycosylase domain-containing protein [bacterium]|nr:lytic transglycosylase domain-containing protein [bacterium]